MSEHNFINHTPGPWNIERHEDDTMTVWANNGSGPRSVCDIIGTMSPDIFNARLIAAAPEMYLALKAVFMASSFDDADGNSTVPEDAMEQVQSSLMRAVMGD